MDFTDYLILRTFSRDRSMVYGICKMNHVSRLRLCWWNIRIKFL